MKPGTPDNKSPDNKATKKKRVRKKPTNETKLTRMKDATIIKAILASNGIISNVAEALGINWHGAKKLIDRNEKTKQAWDEANELMLDYAESKLQTFIDIDPVSLRFYLERKGKDRGYGEKVNIDHTTKGDKLPENTKTAITVLHLPAHLQPKPEQKTGG